MHTPKSGIVCGLGLTRRAKQASPETLIQDVLGQDGSNHLRSDISDITPLGALTNLTQLDLDENRITTLAPLSKMTRLASLDLHENYLVSLKPVDALPHLRTLQVENNFLNLSPGSPSRLLLDRMTNNGFFRAPAPSSQRQVFLRQLSFPQGIHLEWSGIKGWVYQVRSMDQIASGASELVQEIVGENRLQSLQLPSVGPHRFFQLLVRDSADSAVVR